MRNEEAQGSMIKKIVASLSGFLGIEQAPVSHAERIASAIGGFIAIFCIFTISQRYLGSPGAGIIVASMGASAVLLFAVPHGQLSQPWPVLGGHLISAIIGVSCAYLISNEVLAASVAVGVAIAGMYYLKCIHPPGGATALSAVIGGESTHALGYQFVITPVLLNVVIILATAFIFNFFLKWRRYPVYIHKSEKDRTGISGIEEPGELSHGDFVYALSQIDSFIDVSEDDLLRIYELATNRHRNRRLNTDDIVLGSFYSNGEYGDDWSVRQIVDETPGNEIDRDMVIYKVVAGRGRRDSGHSTRVEFAKWAKYRVTRDEENWKRVMPWK